LKKRDFENFQNRILNNENSIIKKLNSGEVEGRENGSYLLIIIV
jgi:hypothetical protein